MDDIDIKGDVNCSNFVAGNYVININTLSIDSIIQQLPQIKEIFLSNPSYSFKNSEELVLSKGLKSISITKGEAKKLINISSKISDLSFYFFSIKVNPLYTQWERKYVLLSGSLTEVKADSSWIDIPTEYVELEVTGQGVAKNINRVHLKNITGAIHRNNAFVLLGEPGSGKTTTLNKILIDYVNSYIEGSSEVIPLLFSLSSYTGEVSPYEFIRQQWMEIIGSDDFDLHIKSGNLLILCDAINEMPAKNHSDMRLKLSSWRDFIKRWKRNKIIMTCRTMDYSEPLGITHVVIDNLDEPKIKKFIREYVPSEKWNVIFSKIKEKNLLDLVKIPYFLVTFCWIISNNGKWPNNKASLFKNFVRILFERERLKSNSIDIDYDCFVGGLQLLAKNNQKIGDGTTFNDHTIKEIFKLAAPEDYDSIYKIALSTGLIERVEKHNSLNTEFRFVHHQIQDYFSSVYLYQAFLRNEDLKLVLLSLENRKNLPTLEKLSFDEPLPSIPSNGWEEPAVLATQLIDKKDRKKFLALINKINPILASRCNNSINNECPHFISKELINLINNYDNDIRVRVAAGLQLGGRCDPRYLHVKESTTIASFPPFHKMKSGVYKVGTSSLERFFLKRRNIETQFDLSKKRISLNEFFLASYPVSNYEYSLFVNDGGYQDLSLWSHSNDSLEWIQGNGHVNLDRWVSTWEKFRNNPDMMHKTTWYPRTPVFWKKAINLSKSELIKSIEKDYKRRPMDTPPFWSNEDLNSHSQPVVGVNFYEANAYCMWINRIMKNISSCDEFSFFKDKVAIIPTEFQWEAFASFPNGTYFPWGNKFNKHAANTLEGQVFRSTPVGIYPKGVSKLGAYDLCGNIWEWTSSLYDKGERDNEIVIKRGSAHKNAIHLQSRLPIEKEYIGYRLGFRIALIYKEE